MKASLFFAAGILFSALNVLPPFAAAAALGFFVILLIPFRERRILGDIFAATVLVAAGMLAHSVQGISRAPLHIPDAGKHGEISVTGSIVGDARFRYGSTWFTMRCNSLTFGDTLFTVSGLLPCVAYGRTISLTDGTDLALRGTVRKILHSSGEPPAIPSPGAFNATERLAVSSVPDGLRVIREGNTLFGRIREAVTVCAGRHPFGGGRDLLLAMTVGDTRSLPPETRDTFTRSGIAHLLAVSGLNVAVVAVTIGFLLGFLPISRLAALAATGFAIFLYAGVCGFAPPITRALVMSLLVSGTYFLERRGDVENSLFAALLIVLAFDPGSLGGASLQLSFAAVWMLIAFFSPVMSFLPRTWRNRKYIRYPLGIAVATLLSSLATAPVAAAHFGLFPLLSLPINLPAVPLSEAITVIGLSTLGLTALGPIFEPAAAVAAHLSGLMIRGLVFLAEQAARIPFASVQIDSVPLLYSLSGALWLYLLSRMTGRPLFRKGLLFLPLLLLSIWSWMPIATASRSMRADSMTFFDVGQGDAALVECAGGAFLVDTGPGYDGYTAAETVLLPALRYRGIRRLDGVFISHFDSDHSGGLSVIMEHMPVERLFCRESARDSLRALYGERVIALAEGDSLAISGSGIIVLAPDAQSRNRTGENEQSLIFRFDAGGHRFLFTGDIDPAGQREVLHWGERLRADILKVPHHGAAGLDPEFLGAVHPRIAVISCGLNNRYGHPAASTLHQLEDSGCTIRRTDNEGPLTIALGSPVKRTP